MADQEIEVKVENARKNYYADPEYREKHLAYVKEKIQCECGKMVCRCYMAAHQRKPVHQKRMAKILKDRLTEEKEQEKSIAGLRARLSELEEKHAINLLINAIREALEEENPIERNDE